jgi:hypothetical protein
LDALYRPPCGPSFVPGGFRDWDLAGAVRGGDFLLTSLLERSTKNSYPYWEILDCCGGRVLLSDIYDEDKPLIVLNPLMRRSAHEFRYPDPDEYPTNPRLICLDEDPPSSFRVALLDYGRCTLQASVFSSDTGEWSALASVDVPAWSADGTSGEDRRSDYAIDKIWIEDEWKMHVNGFIYWVYVWCGDGRDGRYLISLDTTTMEFSFAKLPQCLRRCGFTFTFRAGEAEDGAACIVYSDGSNNVGVVKHTRGDDGVERWVPDRVLRVELDGELKRINLGELFSDTKLSVLAIRDGYVYFSTSKMLHDPTRGCWFMSLCLATMKVEKLFERRYDGDAYAYIMPWPPCLLASNYGQFAFEGAP